MCPAPAGCVPVHNPDFEFDAHGTAYQYQPVTSWVSVSGSGVVVAQNGNAPWGSLDSGNGAYYLVLQNRGSGVQQQISNLAPGATYGVTFLAAERPGYGTNERMQVFVNNQPLVPVGNDSSLVTNGTLIDPPDTAFVPYVAHFVAAASGRNLLSFENASPNSTEDRSVFLDAVQVCLVSAAAATSTSTTTTVAISTTAAAANTSTNTRSSPPAATSSSKGASIAAALLAVACVGLIAVVVRMRNNNSSNSNDNGGGGGGKAPKKKSTKSGYKGLSIKGDAVANETEFDDEYEMDHVDTDA